VLPGVIGSLMAAETIKFLAEVGEPLLGRVLNYDALTASFTELRLSPDPQREPVTTIGANVEGLGGGPASAAEAPADSSPAAEGTASPQSGASDDGWDDRSGETGQVGTGQANTGQADDEPVAADDVDFNPFTGDPKQADDLSPAELRRAVAEGRLAGIVDVREPSEHAGGSIASAVNIPLMDLWHSEEPPPGLQAASDDKPVVVYCAHGVRSRQAVQLLNQRYPDAAVKNLLGGYELWRSS
ncbi:MAG TPA: rhodanese-like domain-containing protein, partial [Deinococcales bacterium]|nr:rhodanese-like domain-containing protein [Deinococcales bacterium]